MRVEIVLTYIDEDGRRRDVAVDSRRFTIGRAADNDLVIDAPDIARRHAVIESFDDGVFIFDCQTAQGTLLNNSPLEETASLQSGDLLTFGATHDYTVRLRLLDGSINTSHTSQKTPSQASQTTGARQHLKPAPPVPLPPSARSAATHQPRRSIVPVVAVAAVLLVMLLGGLILLRGRQSSSPTTAGVDDRAAQSVAPSGTNDADLPEGDGASPSPGDSTTIADEELERAATRVVQRMSGDEKPYVLPPEAFRDVRAEVEALRQSAKLRDVLTAMRPAVRAVAAEARSEGMEPDLVVYAALAQSSEDGHDAASSSRRMIPQLTQLRTTFGSSDADSNLIVLAAYTYGVGSRQSHPLLPTIRRLVRNTFTERNIWHLRERGGLSDAAYRFVVRTIAVGVVAQDPRRYGVQSAPLVY